MANVTKALIRERFDIAAMEVHKQAVDYVMSLSLSQRNQEFIEVFFEWDDTTNMEYVPLAPEEFCYGR